MGKSIYLIYYVKSYTLSTTHRLTMTNGQAEKTHHIIKSATLKLFHYENFEQHKKHLMSFML